MRKTYCLIVWYKTGLLSFLFGRKVKTTSVKFSIDYDENNSASFEVNLNMAIEVRLNGFRIGNRRAYIISHSVIPL